MALTKIKFDISEVQKARDFLKAQEPKLYEEKVQHIRNVHWGEIITWANNCIDQINSQENGQQ